MRLGDLDALKEMVDKINDTDYGSIFDYTAHREVRNVLRDIKRLIDNTPTIEAEPVRHGRWIEADYVYFGAKRFECSLCKDDEYWRKRYHNFKEHYCPNCSAKMDGSAEE